MVKQISIFTENRKGAMRSITRLLAEGGIDIDAFVTNDSAEFGIVRMLVSDPDKASELLTQAGYQIKRTAVMAFGIPDEPGSLDRLLECVEDANINIDYLYASFDRESAGPIIVIRANDMDELEHFLKSRGFRCK
ncbi:MAG: amino acid-binding protein [Ruminococcaceae bacterium]|nr:amino acid-binding protein [Oscillospiraceae bacterium]